MQGDRVGGGDISEVSSDAWTSGDTASCDDGRAAGREHDTGVVIRLGVNERDARAERCRDRADVSDDTRGKYGARDIHRADTGGAHGMRGDRVGVGDIGEVPGDAWRSGDTASGDHIKSAWQQQHAGNVG